MTTTLGISRDSLNAVRQALTDMPHLNVSQISRVCDDLSRHTVYKALELLKAERDDTYFPATYTLPYDDSKRRQRVEDILRTWIIEDFSDLEDGFEATVERLLDVL